MNETLKAIQTRYSCRDFNSTPLTDDHVNALADAALASPSAMNRQPWHVIMITNKGIIDEMDTEAMNILANAEDKTMYERIQSRGGKIFYNAPAMVLVLSDDSRWGALDAGILTQNVALAAHSLGLGNVICAMANIPLSGPKAEEYKKSLGFPEGYSFGMAILVGTANSGKDPHEHDQSKVTYVK